MVLQLHKSYRLFWKHSCLQSYLLYQYLSVHCRKVLLNFRLLQCPLPSVLPKNLHGSYPVNHAQQTVRYRLYILYRTIFACFLYFHILLLPPSSWLPSFLLQFFFSFSFPPKIQYSLKAFAILQLVYEPDRNSERDRLV